MWLFHNSSHNSSLRSGGARLLPILKEFCNLSLISFVAILLYQQLLLELELLAWLLLLGLLVEQGNLLRKGVKKLRKRRQQKKDLKEEGKEKLRGVLLEVVDLAQKRSDIQEKALRENSKLLVSEIKKLGRWLGLKLEDDN